MIKIMVFRANPVNEGPIRSGVELNNIQNSIERAVGYPYPIQVVEAAKKRDLQQNINRYDPEIIHFSGHGNKKGELILEDEHGNSETLRADTLRSIFSVNNESVKCVMLNLCYAHKQAKVIVEHVPCVIGMRSEVEDRFAIAFATEFYAALADDDSIKRAYRRGKIAMDITGAQPKDMPVLLERAGCNADELFIGFRPRLLSRFKIKDGEIIRRGPNYEVITFIENSPSDAGSAFYQYVGYEGDDDFYENLNNPNKQFQTDFTTYGDFQIRATIWRSNGSGIGICKLVSDTLTDYYGKNPAKEIRDAIDRIARK